MKQGMKSSAVERYTIELTTLLCLAIAQFVFCSSAFAQSPPKSNKLYTRNFRPVQFGVKAGFNMSYISNLDQKNYDETRVRFGPAGGIALSFNFSNLWALQVEALYSSKGAKRSSRGCLPLGDDQRCSGDSYWDNYEGLSDEFVLTYLEVPILLKRSHPTGKVVQSFIYGGAYFGFLLSSEGIFSGDETGVYYEGEISMARDVDAGFVGGLGLDIAMRHTALTFEIRYSQGVVDLESPNAFYNGSFAFFAGIVY